MEHPLFPDASQESCKAEPRVLSSLRPRRRTTQSPIPATTGHHGSGGSESLSNLDLSHKPLVALECLPSSAPTGSSWLRRSWSHGLRSSGTKEETRGQRGGPRAAQQLLPHYRSKEESFQPGPPWRVTCRFSGPLPGGRCRPAAAAQGQ